MIVEAQRLVAAYGQKGYQLAKKSIREDALLVGPVAGVVCFFIDDSWANVQHPALVSLACESVGGDGELPDEVGAALVLLTGAADIHDDIIDKSTVKFGKPTAFGKFNPDQVLLAGDILLLKALTLLNNATEKLAPNTRPAIRNTIEQAFVEIACATAQERLYKGNLSLEPEKYREIIFAKGSVSDAFARVGGIIGGGNAREIAALGHFGRTLSVLMSLRSEFVDLANVQELQNRAKNEVLPLPLLCAMQNKAVKPELLALLKGKITVKKTEKIMDLVLPTKEVEAIKLEMRMLAKREETGLKTLKFNGEAFQMLLDVAVQGL
ncbi:MAG: polyprenyl synthetase family protein [Candidatus Bathyarchaeia archaeon]